MSQSPDLALEGMPEADRRMRAWAHEWLEGHITRGRTNIPSAQGQGAGMQKAERNHAVATMSNQHEHAAAMPVQAQLEDAPDAPRPVNIGRVGNANTAPNYGNISQTVQENHLHTNAPTHPDINAHISDCFPGSRTDDVARILRWIDTDQPELVLCVVGKLGVGKSTLAKHLSIQLRQIGRLAGESFFGFSTVDWTPEYIIRMLAGQLCNVHPALMEQISDGLRRNVGPSVPLETRIQTLIVDPIRSLNLGHPLIVVLDALDQWTSSPSLVKALEALIGESHLIRFVVLGRPGLEGQFKNLPTRRYELLKVVESVMVDYFKVQFNHLEWEYNRKPNRQTISQLVEKSQGLFIWSSTLCSLLQDQVLHPNPHETITAILRSQIGFGDRGVLAQLYHQAIELRFPNPEHKAKLKTFLGALLVLQEPLQVEVFASLVSMDARSVRKIQADLSPLQTTQSDPSQNMVYPAAIVFHLSLLEYLQSAHASPQFASPLDSFVSHSQLGIACLRELTRLPQSFSRPTLPSPLQRYAIKYWPLHTVRGTPEASPSSAVAWEATPHHSILTTLTLPQWHRWAEVYTKLVLPDPSIDHRNSDTDPRPTLPFNVLTRTANDLASVPETRAGEKHIALLEMATRLNSCDSQAWMALSGTLLTAAQSLTSSSLLDRAVQACRHACDAGGNSGEQLHQLGTSLQERYSLLGCEDDLREAVECHRNALYFRLQGHPDRSMSLNNLANALQSHYALKGDVESLEEAIVHHRDALSLCPQGHPDHSMSLNNLATALQSHYALKGDVESLEEAIVHHRDALSLCPQGHPDHSMSLNNLATALLSCYKLRGGVETLEEAVSFQQEALSLTPPGHVHHSHFRRNLAKLQSLLDLSRVVT